MLHVEHVSKTFFPGTINEKKALQDLSLHLEPGDFATVIVYSRILCLVLLPV